MEEPLTKKQKRDMKKQEHEQTIVEVEATERRKRNMIWLVSIVVIALGLGLVIWNTAKNTAHVDPVKVDEINANDHKKGKEDSKVTVIEYGDFQCPACGQYFPIIDEVSKNFNDRVLFVFRHFPLRSLHPYAQIAAQAAEAAGKQGKFWEMHDKLFQNQNTWAKSNDPKQSFEQYAQEIGLNVDQYKKDFNGSETKAQVNADYASAQTGGINQTPTFVLNGASIPTPRSVQEFENILNETLKTKETGNTNTNSSENTNDAQ